MVMISAADNSVGRFGFQGAGQSNDLSSLAARPTSLLGELESLKLRSDLGLPLTPVEQGTLARLTAQAKTGPAAPSTTTTTKAPSTSTAPAKTEATAATTGTVKGAKTIDDFDLSNATDQDKADFKAALAYLQAADAKGNAISPTAVKLLAKLPKGAKINFIKNLDAFYDPTSKTINWNPRAAGDLASGKMSPALVLAHEIDHMVAGQKKPKATGDNYDNTEEKRVITGSETKIANELGEPTRKDHRGGLVLVGSSTEHTAVKKK
jgi:hypothetical protein